MLFVSCRVIVFEVYDDVFGCDFFCVVLDVEVCKCIGKDYFDVVVEVLDFLFCIC